MPIKPLLRFCGLSLAAVAVSGCVGMAGNSRVVKLYPGPVRDPSDVAIIHNDRYVYVHPNWHPSVIVLPGEQTLEFSYRKNVGYGTLHSTVPSRIEVNLQPGHQYQVVGHEFNSSLIVQSFLPALEDVTAQSNVWAFYQNHSDEYYQTKAVEWMTDQTNLATVALTCPKPDIRSAAVGKIENLAVLDKILDEEIDASVRREAEARKKELTQPGRSKQP
jgi:hypothetical protein